MTKIFAGAAAAALLAAVSFASPAGAASTQPVAKQQAGAQINTDVSAARRHVRRFYGPRRHFVRRYYGPRYRYGYYGGGPYYGNGYGYGYRPYYAPRPFFGIGPFAFGF